MKFFSRSSRATAPKMRAARVAITGVDEHHRVAVETDVAAVIAAHVLSGPHDHALDDLAGFDLAIRKGLLHCATMMSPSEA